MMVPLIAFAILGSEEAQYYFSPLPATGVGAPPGTARAQFKFTDVAAALRLLMLNGSVQIHQNDIGSHPWGADEVYFSERLQTACLDALF